MRRAALNCIKSVVNKKNVKDIVGDLLQAIEELEFGVEPEEEDKNEKTKVRSDFVDLKR